MCSMESVSREVYLFFLVKRIFCKYHPHFRILFMGECLDFHLLDYVAGLGTNYAVMSKDDIMFKKAHHRILS